MASPDDIMLRRKPKVNPLYPEPKVPEGALVRKGREVPSVVPVVRVEQRGKKRGRTNGLGVTVGVEVSF
jgi:hypothetical protein